MNPDDLEIVLNRIHMLSGELTDLGQERSQLMGKLSPDWEGEHQELKKTGNQIVKQLLSMERKDIEREKLMPLAKIRILNDTLRRLEAIAERIQEIKSEILGEAGGA